MNHALKALIVGEFWHGSLEGSYSRALSHAGLTVREFDLGRAIRSHTRLGKFGRFVNTYLPIDGWIQKANRDLIVFVREFNPDIVFIGGASAVRVGALAQIKTCLPQVKLVLIWPDTMLRILPHVAPCIPLYDLIASYSSASLRSFSALGGSKAIWVPLAVDPVLHSSKVEQQEKLYDVVFVGGYRPEREEALLRLYHAGFKVHVWGEAHWPRYVRDRKAFKNYWHGGPAYGSDFYNALRMGRLSINPIDPTNYPAANMRFFESLACRTVTINSRCPEMEPIFPHRALTCYYETLDDLEVTARELLENQALAEEIAEAGHREALASHTYSHRVSSILRVLNLPE